MASPETLAGIPLFASLGEAERAQLATWFDEKNVSEGVRLVGEGAAGYSFFVLVDGTVEVVADGATLAQLGPGDFFGEMAILGDGRRVATVTSTSPARVLVLFGTEFRQLQEAHPAVAAQLEDVMRQRLEARR